MDGKFNLFLFNVSLEASLVCFCLLNLLIGHLIGHYQGAPCICLVNLNYDVFNATINFADSKKKKKGNAKSQDSVYGGGGLVG